MRNVYDPTCGSGSLLLRAASIGNAVDIYGQEKNPTTYNLARMNMLLHGIRFSNFKIEMVIHLNGMRLAIPNLMQL